MATFLMLAGVLLLWVAFHPFTTYPLSLRLLRALPGFRKGIPIAADGQLSSGDIAVCMCAYNEERVIGAKLANLLEMKRANPGLEIYVYVDGSTDRTAELLRAYESEIKLVVSTERRGKTHGMNRLVAMVDKPIVLFTDANVIVDPRAPARVLRYFADPEIGCVCGQLSYTNAESSVTAESGTRYWKLEESIKRFETDTGSAIGADGSLFALRRALHRPPPDDIIDDMYVSLMVFCEGHRVVQADDVRAFEKSVTSEGEEYIRKVRIACQAFNVHRVLWDRIWRMDALSIYRYASHKLIRWLAVFFMAAGLVSFELGLLASGHLKLGAALPITAIACLVIGYRAPTGPFAQAFSILSAFAGTGMGVVRSMRGERFQTWTPATSIREAPQLPVE